MIVARAIADMRSPLSDPSRQTAMFAIDILEQRKLGVVIKELPYSSYWARSTRLIRSCSLGSAYQTFALTSLVGQKFATRLASTSARSARLTAPLLSPLASRATAT